MYNMTKFFCFYSKTIVVLSKKQYFGKNLPR